RTRSYSATSRARSSDSTKLPLSHTTPDGERYGSSSGLRRFLSLSSTGSIPRRRAARSMSASVTKVETGRPTPRYGPIGALSVAHPLRGPSRESCEGADGNLLGVERALHTEAAPHVGSDDAKPVRRQVEQLGKRLPQEARHLRGRPERQLSRARVPVGETGPV